MRLSAVLKAVVTAGLLAGFLHQSGSQRTLDTVRAADAAGVAAMLGLTVLMILTIALRWHLLLRPLEGPACRFREVSEATFLGYCAGYFLPSVGGDVVRVSRLVKPGRHVAALALSTLVDRGLGLLALLALGLTAVAVHGAAGARAGAVWIAYLGAAGVLAAMLALGLVSGPAARWLAPLHGSPARRLAPLARTVAQAAQVYRARTAVLLLALGLAVVGQLLSVAIYYGLARAVGAGGGLLDFLYAVPVVHLAMVMPISLGGLGVGEWTFVHVFTDLGMPRDAAFSVSLLNLLARLGAGAAGSAVCVLGRRA
jgi:uncharacterized membrane protein YbhN (UPF0104 family)